MWERFASRVDDGVAFWAPLSWHHTTPPVGRSRLPGVPGQLKYKSKIVQTAVYFERDCNPLEQNTIRMDRLYFLNSILSSLTVSTGLLLIVSDELRQCSGPF